MQLLEGEIGLKMFRWAIDTNTPLISVHDSYACKWYHEQQVWAAMQTFWTEVVNENRNKNWLLDYWLDLLFNTIAYTFKFLHIFVIGSF